MSSLPTLDDILSHDEDGTRGFAIEIDCHIPEHLHDKFRDLPIFPEKIKINESMISERTRVIRTAKFGGVGTFNDERLAPNLLPKKNYICHVSALKTYIELGGVIDRIHRGVEFNQSKWLAPYIEVTISTAYFISLKYHTTFLCFITREISLTFKNLNFLQFNTTKRIENRENAFKYGFHKLLINAFYGSVSIEIFWENIL